MAIATGEKLIDVEEAGDGWMWGTSETSGKRGLFPASYVELKEVEKKKPPPVPPSRKVPPPIPPKRGSKTVATAVPAASEDKVVEASEKRQSSSMIGKVLTKTRASFGQGGGRSSSAAENTASMKSTTSTTSTSSSKSTTPIQRMSTSPSTTGFANRSSHAMSTTTMFKPKSQSTVTRPPPPAQILKKTNKNTDRVEEDAQATLSADVDTFVGRWRTMLAYALQNQNFKDYHNIKNNMSTLLEWRRQMYLAYDDVVAGKADSQQYQNTKNSILKLIEATKQQNESFSVPRTEDGAQARVEQVAVSKLVELHKEMRTRMLDGSKLPRSALEQYVVGP